MRTRRRGALGAAPLALALLASGCALVRGAPAGGPGLRTFLLLPANVVAPVPPGLESGLAFVDTELRSYLESQGRRVEALGPREAHAEWLATAQALTAAGDETKRNFESAASALAPRLRAERAFDALVIPWVALRRAKVRGRSVSWDGVERTLRVENPEGRSLVFLRDFEAEAACPSLQVAVFSARGERLFEGVGGLDLVHSLVVEGDPPRVDAESLPRAQIFADRAALQEGIARAFDPLLSRPEAAAQTPSAR
jgi:hypothetical protein